MATEGAAQRAAPRFAPLPDAGLAIIVLLHVALVWWTPHFPTQDGPAHLHNADVLLRLSDPESPAFREFYELNPSPSPNWLGHVILAVLLAAFPPPIAEKIFLSLYVIGFALAVRYALRSARAGAASLALLATPLVFDWHLHMGFYNFCIGVALWCVAFGYWLRRRGLRGARQVAFFSLLCILLYASHPIALVSLGLALGAATLWTAAARRVARRAAAGEAPTAEAPATEAPTGEAPATEAPTGEAPATDAPRSRGLGARLLLPLVASLPAVALFFVFQRNPGRGETLWAPVKTLVMELATLDPLVALSESERPIAAAFAAFLALVAVLALLDRPQRREASGVSLGASPFAAAGALFALYFAAPTGIGGCWYVNGRILVFAVLALLIAIGARPLRPWLARTSAVAGLLFGLAFLLARGPTTLALGTLLAESATAAQHITPGATIVSVGFSHQGRAADGSPLSTRIKAFLHLGSAMAVARGAIDLRNYEANTAVFPVRYRLERQPFRAMAADENMEAEPPRIDFIHYTERTGARVDYVLISGFTAAHEHDMKSKSIQKQLAYSYEKVFVSPGSGFVQLYKLAERSSMGRAPSRRP